MADDKIDMVYDIVRNMSQKGCSLGAAHGEAISTLKADSKQHDKRIVEVEKCSSSLTQKISQIPTTVEVRDIVANTMKQGNGGKVVAKVLGTELKADNIRDFSRAALVIVFGVAALLFVKMYIRMERMIEAEPETVRTALMMEE